MKIILVSCVLLSTSLAFASEYGEGVSLNSQPSRKDKRFIFNKSAHIQKLIQGITAFSSISNNNKNVPLPPPAKTTPRTTPTPTTTAAPSTTTRDPSSATIAFPEAIPTKAASTTTAPQTDNDNLDYLTQYHNNVYALPETAPRSGLNSQSQSTVDRLPPLPAKQQISDDNTPLKQYSQQSFSSPHIYTQSFSSHSLSPPQYSSDLNLATISSLPASLPTLQQSYSQPISYLPSPQIPFTETDQTYIPQQQVLSVPQLSPVTYQSHQSHLSYVPSVHSSLNTASLGYGQYQPLSTDQYHSFSNNQHSSTHTQTAYFGNTYNTGSTCACKGYK